MELNLAGNNTKPFIRALYDSLKITSKQEAYFMINKDMSNQENGIQILFNRNEISKSFDGLLNIPKSSFSSFRVEESCSFEI
jgi:hypothetical protein